MRRLISAKTTELSKSYDPHAIDAAIEKLWNDNRAFHAEPTDPGEPYAIVIPPPNVTAALHLGHALNNTLQDILIRWHRMRATTPSGCPAPITPASPRRPWSRSACSQEEGKTPHRFQARGVRRQDPGVEGRVRRPHHSASSRRWAARATGTARPSRWTSRAKAVREAFFQLFKDGLIYRGKRLVNWDPATQTALADDEVEMEEIDGHFYYLRYPLEDGTGHVTVATTRPETMLGDTAVAINPQGPARRCAARQEGAPADRQSR